MSRVLLVSNRLPVTLRQGEGPPVLVRSAGGLATALGAAHDRLNSYWVGTVGPSGTVGEMAPELEQQLSAKRATTVSVSPSDAHLFYAKLSNGVIWPLFHDRLDRLPSDLGGWDAYERVNEAFAARIADLWRPGDVIWVHDYHLMRLPALLRHRLPGARIGFFLHIPFPNPELFLVLPSRRPLIEGMLGADVIGFHSRRYRGHFTAVVRRLLGIEMDADSHVRYENRAVSLAVAPIGVDAQRLAHCAWERDVSQKVLDYRPSRQRLVVGVDRLDYSKGLVRRLAAIERLLTRWPQWRRHIRFVQVAVPTRGSVSAYRRHRSAVERLVTRINGRFGTPSWVPIHFLYRGLPEEDILALYRAADVLLVTPLRDGMNLVAKEFVATRVDEGGVLVLSEFAGAADELREALIVNPYDLDEVANSVHAALTMDRDQRVRRMRALRAGVVERDVHWWANSFLDALRDPHSTLQYCATSGATRAYPEEP